MENSIVNVYGYIRVSTEGQVKQGYSLAEQRAEIEKYCSSKGYNLNVDGKCILWFETDCDSASTELEDCDIYAFVLYPTEGLVLNGYEFMDIQMRNVVNYFGNPNSISVGKEVSAHS